MLIAAVVALVLALAVWVTLLAQSRRRHPRWLPIVALFVCAVLTVGVVQSLLNLAAAS